MPAIPIPDLNVPYPAPMPSEIGRSQGEEEGLVESVSRPVFEKKKKKSWKTQGYVLCNGSNSPVALLSTLHKLAHSNEALCLNIQHTAKHHLQGSWREQ